MKENWISKRKKSEEKRNDKSLQNHPPARICAYACHATGWIDGEMTLDWTVHLWRMGGRRLLEIQLQNVNLPFAHYVVSSFDLFLLRLLLCCCYCCWLYTDFFATDCNRGLLPCVPMVMMIIILMRLCVSLVGQVYCVQYRKWICVSNIRALIEFRIGFLSFSLCLSLSSTCRQRPAEVTKKRSRTQSTFAEAARSSYSASARVPRLQRVPRNWTRSRAGDS